MPTPRGASVTLGESLPSLFSSSFTLFCLSVGDLLRLDGKEIFKDF